MIRILLVGICGRMGREIAKLCRGSETFEIVCGVDTGDGTDLEVPIYEGFADVKEDYDVLIDFSSAALAPSLLDYLAEVKKPAVLCTTGYREDDEKRLNQQSGLYPTFRSANMSVGIYVLSLLAAEANRLLGADFDCEILEAHHRRKKDAPSGTAYLLAKAIQDSDSRERPLTTDRSARHEARRPGEIGIQALRLGAVAGDHEVYFGSDSEIVKLSHHAENRSVFASGALRAARFIKDQPAGLYDMSDMLKG